jgi:2-keto-3-deoxy-6-phosphogluconate aldolase
VRVRPRHATVASRRFNPPGKAAERPCHLRSFFPAGGIAALKALAGPFPQVRFCPTGGIGEESFLDWLKLPNVASVGGSWLAPATDIRAGNWPAITARARRAVEMVEKVGR